MCTQLCKRKAVFAIKARRGERKKEEIDSKEIKEFAARKVREMDMYNI
jgi:hypothetical protein